jgi:hypothetical protein
MRRRLIVDWGNQVLANPVMEHDTGRTIQRRGYRQQSSAAGEISSEARKMTAPYLCMVGR